MTDVIQTASADLNIKDMSDSKVIRWGILATGGIAATFTKDLLIDPQTRGTKDIKHVVTAVASSSSLTSAESFISKIIKTKQPSLECRAFGSYEEFAQNAEVDIVYVATPHSHHYQNCRLLLDNNKAILCEKSLTVNAKQAKILYDIARKKKLFFMEAVWTRYFPLSIQVRDWIRKGKIGEVQKVTSDLSIGLEPEVVFDLSHRMVNKDLAGGCLLDLGIYSLTWIFQTVYHTLSESERQAPKVVGTAMTHYPSTGADESTTMLLEFPKSPPSGRNSVHAIATTSLRTHFDSGKGTQHEAPAVRIFGDKGEIQVYGPIYRPQHIKLITRSAEEGKEAEVEDRTFEFPGDGHGMFWEADEAARCWSAGKLESQGLSWSESILIMETMDEVRKQGNLTYPKEIETTDYPTNLRSRGK